MRPPITCNPAWDRAERETRGWAMAVGLVRDNPGRRRLGRMAHGRMAGWLSPGAGPSELSLLAQWGAFISLVDDTFDTEQGGGDPGRVRRLMDQLVAVVAGSPADADPSVPAVRAIADLWRRTLPSTGLEWAPRFVEHYRLFADATCHEAWLRASGAQLDLQRYLELRRHTITALPMLDLVERALAIEAPALDGLRLTVADTIAMVNDLGSAARERAEGKENVVGVVARERGCDPAEAAAIVRGMLADLMDDFDAAAAVVGASGRDQARLESRIARIRDVRDGSVNWQGETHRNDAGPDARAASPQASRGVVALSRHLAPAVSASGAIADRCASRVLDSALLLALLRTTATHRHERERLERYLRDRRASADEIDALLIDACLDPARIADTDVGALPIQLSRGTAGRGRLKGAMFRTVLYLLCGAPPDLRDAPPPASPADVTTFTDVNVLAIRIVTADACGAPHTVTQEERERLIGHLERGRDRLLWEAGATTHLLGLHAVATSRPGHRIVTDGILRMTLAQSADGGLPFLDSQDVWLAAVAGLAFLDDAALRPLVRRMADFVASWQAPDGGWPFASGMAQTDVDTATRCMELLRAADARRYCPELERATAYLTAMAAPSGGVPTWVRSDTPDLDMTAGAILALAPDHERHRDLLARATDFVLESQLPDGSFERSWTISEASAILRVVDALDAVSPHADAEVQQRIATATRRAVAQLAATQQADGGWGHDATAPSDVLSTAQAVPVVVRHGDPGDALAALVYLLSRQDPDGGFTAPPDQVGPRPLAFDFPVLADIHVLSALQRAGQLANVAAARAARQGRSPPYRRARDGEPDWSLLEDRLQGMLVRPRDAAYEQARLVVNQRYDDVRPQALAYPASVEDVVECVDFARDGAVALALRSGGHSYAGYSTCPGLVLDVGALNTASIGGGRALLGAGVRGMQAHLALAAAGAGLPLGRCPTIGLAGATLGGGLSAFTRAWGLACDRLRSVEIVTADGRVRRVGPDSEPPDHELFWALTGGGGGNFGVATAFEFVTQDIRDLSFTTFLMAWPPGDVAAVLRGWSIWNADPDMPRAMRAAYEQLSDGGAPSLPTVTGTFIGTPAELGPLLDDLAAAAGTPECRRLVSPCSYVQAAAEPERWGAGTWGARVAFAAKSHIVRAPLTVAAAADMAEAIDEVHRLVGPRGASGLMIDALGGAVADRGAAETAFPHRGAVGVVQYHSYWNQFSERRHVEQRLRWLRDIHARMQGHLGAGGYTNGMDPELVDWPAAYHGENYARLQRVKATVDPDRLFDFPQAVTPDHAHDAGAGRPRWAGDRPRTAAPSVGRAAADSALRLLAPQLRGRLLLAGDAGYDEARAIRNRRYDHVRPLAIVRVADEQDVAACLAFAAQTRVHVAIRAGAHNYAGFCTGPGLIIDVGALNSVTVQSGRVRLGAGVDSSTATRLLAGKRLAIGVARWGTVGVAGLALGGGKSAFNRAWGLTCDRVVGATIVTPDGAVRTPTATAGDPDAELLWALRGAGGGNFGVVTALEFDAVDISGLGFARFVMRWPEAATDPAVRGWLRWLVDPSTPREVSSDMRIMLSGADAGQPTMHGAWIGEPAALHRTLDRLVASVGSRPVELTVTPCDIATASMSAENPLEHTGAAQAAPLAPNSRAGPADRRFAWAGKSHIVREPLDGAAIATLTEAVRAARRIGTAGGVYFDSLTGAVADTRPGETAFPHRDAVAVLGYVVSWDGDGAAPEALARTDWLRASHAAMQVHLGTGAYVNDSDPELVDWEHAYYGDNYPRLQRVKATYDPTGVLDFPQAIRAWPR